MTTHLGYIQQVLAPHQRVSVVAQQEHFAGIAIAGPQAVATMAALAGTDLPAHMGLINAVIADVPVLVLAASYSGERAFEIYAPGHDAGPVWDVLAAAVAARGGCPYGLEALEFLRIEKGHIVIGGEADGRTTPHDLRLEKMLRKTLGYIGASALARPELSAAGRLQLVGLVSSESIPEGAMLVDVAGGAIEGHVTSAGPRVLGEGSVALALLTGGRARLGNTLLATSPTRGKQVRVEVVEPVFHDPDGANYRD